MNSKAALEFFDRQSDNVKGALILMLRQIGMTILLAPVLLKSFPHRSTQHHLCISGHRGGFPLLAEGQHLRLFL